MKGGFMKKDFIYLGVIIILLIFVLAQPVFNQPKSVSTTANMESFGRYQFFTSGDGNSSGFLDTKEGFYLITFYGGTTVVGDFRLKVGTEIIGKLLLPEGEPDSTSYKNMLKSDLEEYLTTLHNRIFR
jgi:hypothetical protein